MYFEISTTSCPSRTSLASKKTELDETAQGCYNVLKELSQTLDKYQELGPGAKSISGKSRRVWKRFQWDQKEIDQFRSRSTLNISVFGTFLGRLTR